MLIFSKLCFDNSYYNSHGPEKVSFNFSHHLLKEFEKSLLGRGLNFPLLPKNRNYADLYYLLNYHLGILSFTRFPVRKNSLYVVG